jgi:trans-L-3-hydroxyproline dehydratase
LAHSLDLDTVRAALDRVAAPGTTRVVTVDAHTEGEPLRLVVAGFPELRGDTVRARREDAGRRYDALRTALMWEPRGHADMYGCVLTPPERAGSHLGVVFLHNAGYSTMCGHGVLAVARLAVELGLVEATEPDTLVVLDTPAGAVRATVRVRGGRVQAVSFRNVPSWVVGLDRSVDVPGLGSVSYDLAFGGAFYAYVRASSLGLELVPAAVPRLIEAAGAIKAAVSAADPPVHPAGEDLSFLYGVILVGPPSDPAHHSRNVCVFAEGEVDRSPTGTGVSGRLAIHHARGEVAPGQTLVIESVLGTRFACRIVEMLEHRGSPAVIAEVEGRTFVTGWSEWSIDPADPLRHGFLLRG